jgi:hypothetical protein
MRALKITEVNAVAGGGYYNEDGFYISTNPMEELLSYEAQILANRCNADGVAGPSVNAGISVGLNATNTTTNSNVSGSTTSTTNTNTNCSNQSASFSIGPITFSTSNTTCPGTGAPAPTK